jgi:hypothetical protein
MVFVEHRVGRLVAIRVETPVTMEELEPALIRFAGLTAKVSGKFIAVVDSRKATVLSPEVADRFTALMRNDNPRIERAGFIIGESAGLSLQLERMVRTAGNPMRRAFRSVEKLCAWMDEALLPAESRSLREFLS